MKEYKGTTGWVKDFSYNSKLNSRTKSRATLEVSNTQNPYFKRGSVAVIP